MNPCLVCLRRFIRQGGIRNKDNNIIEEKRAAPAGMARFFVLFGKSRKGYMDTHGTVFILVYL